MTSFNVGVIGLGGMGRVMLADMQKHHAFTVKRVWDPSADTCASVHSQYPDIKISPDAAALINDDAVNLVYVASPPNSHREYYLLAIEAGTPMLCEKPFGVDVNESKDLVARLSESKFPNLINFNHGNALGSTHIENELKSGAMGSVTGADVYIHLTIWPREFQKSATWLGRREQGGFTREMISHWLYLTRRLLGDGEIVSAKINYPEDGTSAETHLTAELDFGGIPLFIRVATGGVGPVGTEYTLWGSKISYRLHSGGRISFSDGGDWTELFTDLDDIGANDRQRTLDGVRTYFDGEEIAMPSAEDGFAVQKLVEALLAYGSKQA
jgi:1,5-anhydro-D-fructose reductase (1,5-anhydro-D-mannitol-forming)